MLGQDKWQARKSLIWQKNAMQVKLRLMEYNWAQNTWLSYLTWSIILKTYSKNINATDFTVQLHAINWNNGIANDVASSEVHIEGMCQTNEHLTGNSKCSKDHIFFITHWHKHSKLGCTMQWWGDTCDTKQNKTKMMSEWERSRAVRRIRKISESSAL